ncbi:protein kinase domain-containing protein [Streptomyces lavendulae]|uniref:protein kinase domain-containing protein n=1 Tax=Streptomyces lavendulae TaxID=1914 RepID=UPI0036B6A215
MDDPVEIGGYQLLGRLGQGGMGVVYIGRGPQGNVVAIKVVRPQYANDNEFRRRFMREVRLAQRTTGPGLVEIVAADTDATQPWLATEYIAGPTLADAVVQHGPLETSAWAGLAHQLGTALHTVHEAGTMHRDLKPANVLLSRTGPRLIDFGIARAHGDTALTNVGQAIGTIGYMAPEYLTTATADERADLFAFGAVLAYAATGRHPFGHGRWEQVQFRSVHEPPDLAGLSPRIADLLKALLDKNPYRRPPLIAALREIPAPDPAQAWLPAAILADIAAAAEHLLRLKAPRNSHPMDPQPEPTSAHTFLEIVPAPPRSRFWGRMKDAFNGVPVDDNGSGPDIQELRLSRAEAQSGGPMIFSAILHEPCSACNGRGMTAARLCRSCSGSGHVPGTRQPVTIAFAPGISSGTFLLLPGMGYRDSEGNRGDLYLRVSVLAR